MTFLGITVKPEILSCCQLITSDYLSGEVRYEKRQEKYGKVKKNPTSDKFFCSRLICPPNSMGIRWRNRRVETDNKDRGG